jgi:hypothetical protein
VSGFEWKNTFIFFFMPAKKGLPTQNDSKKKAADRMFAGANHLLFRKAAELRKHQTMRKKCCGVILEQNRLALIPAATAIFELYS